MLQATSPPEWWINSHFAFAAYVLPAVLIASALENAFTLAALLSMRQGIGRTTRTLFMVLGIADLLNLLAWYSMAVFGEHGLRYLTHGEFYFRAINERDVACKTVRSIGFLTTHCSHWLYVLVNAERLLAVLLPHRSTRFRKPSCLFLPIGMVLIGGLLCAGFSAIMYNVKPSAAYEGATISLHFSE